MTSQIGGRIIALSTTLFLSVTPLTVAQTATLKTPSFKISDSLIFPYLLDDANDNSVVRVSCVDTNKQERDFKRSQVDVDATRRLVRKYLLQATSHNQDTPVIVEIEGSCRAVQIRLQDNSHFWNFPVNGIAESRDDSCGAGILPLKIQGTGKMLRSHLNGGNPRTVLLSIPQFDKIHPENMQRPVNNPYCYDNNADFDDRWLTREGSGWYWILQHR